MTEDEFLGRLAAVRRWKSGGQRAPHKPLLLLLALARVQRGKERLVAFSDIEVQLRSLLVEFGPRRRSYHPGYPFWHLVSDDLWELEGAELLADRDRADAVPVSLLRAGVEGGFPREVHSMLRDDPALMYLAAKTVLDEHFAPSLHEDLLASVGLDLDWLGAGRAQRDPSFRLAVLVAYDYQCAMCGYDGQLETVSVGVDAAHIRWWAHGGPDAVSNGVALCALHHRAFDGGVVTVDLEGRSWWHEAFGAGLPPVGSSSICTAVASPIHNLA